MRMLFRAVVVACLLGAAVGCSLVVSTTGLAGEPDAVDAARGTGSTDAMVSDDARADAPQGFAGDSGGDGRVDADAGDDARVLWPVNGHRYEVRVYLSPRTWLEARDDAALSGGHLVTITSANEESFVASLVYARTDTFDGSYGPWIGAYQPNPTANDGGNEPAGGWAWVTGETWSYHRWASGEPNNSGGHEDYAQYFYDDANRGWNDNDLWGSDLVRSAVIEYE